MRSKKPTLKPKFLIASTLLWCAFNLLGQSAPTINTQPVSQSVLPGANITFNVTAGGTGPFSYQWQLDGTNLPNALMISTMAGNGTATYAGDGGFATNASLLSPGGVASDSSGNLYIADDLNNRIRVVGASGLITTVAGKGTPGFNGDGGAATNAGLNNPLGVVGDASGNFYIADTVDNRIRKVDTNGIITTVAGSARPGYSGDGGKATNAMLSTPQSILVDAASDIIFADAGNYRIRKVGTNGIITTVAGNGNSTYGGDGGMATNAGFNNPVGVALGTNGNLYIADNVNNRIREVDTNGIITTVAGKGSAGFSGDGGAATNATLRSPSGVGLDSAGNLYIADSGNARIRKVDTNGIITTIVGSGTKSFSGDGGLPTNASLNDPAYLTLDAVGNLFISDVANNRIREVNFAGSPALMLTNISANNAGNYTVVISNLYGSVTSAVATLTVQAPPVITVQPASQIADAGSSPIFSILVAGSGPFWYQWYSAGTDLLQSGTNNLLALPSVSTNDAGNYTVFVTNNYGGATSQVANLAVLLPTSTGPIPPGSSATFGVAVGGGGPFSYQWQVNGTNLPNNIITTVAGGGSVGNGGPATNAVLRPWNAAFDSFGNLYICDIYSQSIRKLDTNGIISTVAGNGVMGFSGDGGAATNASLNSPQGVVLDAFGNAFIADYANHRIRKVDTNGIITTVAGTGIGAVSADGGPGTNTALYYPAAVALDALGDLYIADSLSSRIRKMDTNGIITTVAGANAGLSFPTGVGLDAAGNIYIVDGKLKYRICKVDTNGIATTVAGTGVFGFSGDGGAATNAELDAPQSLALDATGNLFVADSYNYRIREVDTNGIISTVAGNGSFGNFGDGGAATNASLGAPQGVALDPAGNIFIADTYYNHIRKVDTNGIITTVAGTNLVVGGIAATNAHLYQPVAVALDLSGNIYIADYNNSCIRKVDTNGIINAIAGNDYQGFSGDGGAATNASLNSPQGVAIDAAGNIYISDSFNERIRKVDTNGIISTFAGHGQPGFGGGGNTGYATNVGLNAPLGLCTDVQGNVFLADGHNQDILMIGTNGTITNRAGIGSAGHTGDGGPANFAFLDFPSGVAVDTASNIFIADTDNHRIRKVGANGNINTVAGNGTGAYTGDGGKSTNASLNFPNNVTVDSADNLYIADTSNQRIRLATSNGFITTLAGTGVAGFSGDGGAATNAGLNYPQGVALDGAGNLYIADASNNRIREVHLAGFPFLTLTNLSTNNSGSYTLVLTSPYGSVTSAVASLTVGLPPPQILTGDASFGFLANQFGFNLGGAAGQTIIVDGSSNLLDWLPLFTNTLSGSQVYFADPSWTNFPARFYRARLP